MTHWRIITVLFPAAALLLSGCGDKEKEKSSGTGAGADDGAGGAAAIAPAAIAPAAVPALGADERAAALGIVGYLPADTEAVIAVYNGNEMLKRLKGLKLWKFLEEQGAMDEIGVPDDLGDTGADEFGPGTVFGEEFFLATGPGTGEQLDNLMRVNKRLSHFQMKMAVEALAAMVSGDESEEVAGPDFEIVILNLIKDPESGLGVIERAVMPPLLLGFKASGEAKESAAQELAAMVESMGANEDFIEPVSFERAGSAFAGYRMIGSKLSEMMREEAADEMDEVLDPAEKERLLKAIAAKNLVVASGVVGDYVMVFAASSVEDCKLAEKPSSSLASHSDFGFVDGYLDKEILAVSYGTQSLLDGMTKEAGGLSSMAGGIREGLAATDAFGNTRDIEALLQIVCEREAAVMATVENSTGGLVAFLDEGLRMESFGGSSSPMALDPEATHKLAGVGEGEDVVLFSNWVSTEEYGDLVTAYVEALGETSYAIAAKLSKMEIEDDEFAQFQEGFELFDTRMREPVLKLWKELSGNFADGLGTEGALVIDLSGSVPPVPGIPQELVDDGVAPRLTYICPVKDREKLQQAWGGIDAASRELLKVASEFAEEEIPMQQPMSSEKDGLKTWFFSAPFFTDDFVPSVTLDDKWFVASTSKERALNLVGALDGAGEARTGSWVRMDFDALRTFGGRWLEVVDKHGEAIFEENPSALEDYRENRPMIDELMAALSELDELTIHSRIEGGKQRVSCHLRTR